MARYQRLPENPFVIGTQATSYNHPDLDPRLRNDTPARNRAELQLYWYLREAISEFLFL
jgi:hypothetical protein